MILLNIHAFNYANIQRKNTNTMLHDRKITQTTKLLYEWRGLYEQTRSVIEQNVIDAGFSL